MTATKKEPFVVTVTATVDPPVDPVDLFEGLDSSLGAAASGTGERVSVTMTVQAENAVAAPRIATQNLLAVLLSRAEVVVFGVQEIQVLTPEEQDRQLAEPSLPELAGVAEVAERLGVSKQRVDQLRKRPDFPSPIATLKSGPIWSAASLTHFVEGWKRKPGRPKTTTEEVLDAVALGALAVGAVVVAQEAVTKGQALALVGEATKVAKAAAQGV